MITLLAVGIIAIFILMLYGIGMGLVAISPILAVILCLPLLDLMVFKLIKEIRKERKKKKKEDEDIDII